MKNEYLFLDDKHRKSIESYKPNDVSVEILEIKDTSLWIIAFSLKSKSEDSANKLSNVHSFVVKYSPMILSCESSEYYNKILFPLINEFERKLRKVLYIAASKSDSKDAKKTICNLEEKDFGELFDILFIDQQFITEMKKRVNADKGSEYNGRNRYSKAEIQVYLNSIEERTLWDTILGSEAVPTLRKRFRDAHIYRNDVMHAHNMGKEQYRKAQYLFEKINEELNSEINKLIGQDESEPIKVNHNINTAISTALALEAENLSTYSDAVKNSTALTDALMLLAQAIQRLQPHSVKPALLDAIKGISTPGLSEVLNEISDDFNK